MSIHLLCVGKLKEKFYLEAVEEYRKRLSSSCRLTLLELPEQPLPAAPSGAQIERALEREAGEIFSKLPKSALLVALCVEGSLLSSEELAARLSRWTVEGSSALSFVIGGSFGLHASVKEAAALRLSMSPMTFPHHLARVMVLEQLYRAFKIQEGSPYHK